MPMIGLNLLLGGIAHTVRRVQNTESDIHGLYLACMYLREPEPATRWLNAWEAGHRLGNTIRITAYRHTAAKT